VVLALPVESAPPSAPIATPVVNEASKSEVPSRTTKIELTPEQTEALRKELEKKRASEEKKARERELLDRTPNLEKQKNKTIKQRESIPKRF